MNSPDGELRSEVLTALSECGYKAGESAEIPTAIEREVREAVWICAALADLLEEMEVVEDETIFRKGDPGDSMYLIVDGRVCVHNGGQFLNYLGESDVFGDLALLGLEPRLASVTAVKPTRLFCLDRSPVFQLMAERPEPEVAAGIIRVLTRHLREQVQDLAWLNTRLRELELASPGSAPVAA